MNATHTRSQKKIKLARALNFFGHERIIVEDAFPGDIIGIVDTTGSLRIGDTLCSKGKISFQRVPSFSPENFGIIEIQDPLKRKQLKKGLEQLAEEGVVQIYRREDFSDQGMVLAAVGALQFEVLKFRLISEYRVDARIDPLSYALARWVKGSFDPSIFNRREDSLCLYDLDRHPVVLFRSEWSLNWATENYPELTFLPTAPLE